MLLALLLALQEQAPEPGHIGDGPLHFRTLSPFQAVRAGFAPVTPSNLPPGCFELGHAASWVNLWAYSQGRWLLDYEIADNSLWLSMGLSDRFVATVEVQHSARFGGHIDHWIEEFHDLFGLPQGHREEFPEDDFHFEVAPDGSRPAVALSKGDRGTFVTSGTATLQYALTPGDEVWPAISVGLSIRAASHADIHSQGIDASLSLSAARRFGDFHVYVSGNFAWYGHEDFQDIELRPLQWTWLAAVEWRFMPRTTFVFQYLLSQGAVSRYEDFSKPSHEITFGWKVELWPGTVIEIGVVENIVTFDNSPDVGMHGGITYRW